jgi:hypothetical protein
LGNRVERDKQMKDGARSESVCFVLYRKDTRGADYEYDLIDEGD